jgi:hypothetical protein
MTGEKWRFLGGGYWDKYNIRQLFQCFKTIAFLQPFQSLTCRKRHLALTQGLPMVTWMVEIPAYLRACMLESKMRKEYIMDPTSS